MNSVFLKILAVILALAAILLAWNGYRMNNRMATDPHKTTPAPVFQIAVAARPLAIGSKISADDIKMIERTQNTQQAFSDPASLIDKVTTVAVTQDEIFLEWKHFASNPSLANSLRPGERGVAIKVSEVIGAGGFVKPGDHVDVLLYLRKDAETSNFSLASKVLSNVRVIAYGEAVANNKKAEPDSTKATTPARSTANASDDKQAKESRSAVLAVAEHDATKLMLADNSGQIRLALRNPQESNNAIPEKPDLLNLDELLALPKTKALASNPVAKPSQKRATSKSNDAITVYRGSKQELVYTSGSND